MANKLTVKTEKAQDWTNMSDLAQLLAEINFDEAAKGAAQTFAALAADGIAISPEAWLTIWTIWANAQDAPVAQLFEAPEMPEQEPAWITELGGSEWLSENGLGSSEPTDRDWLNSLSASEWAMTRETGRW